MTNVLDQNDVDAILFGDGDSTPTVTGADVIEETKRVIAEVAKLPEGERRAQFRDELRATYETVNRSYVLDLADMIAGAGLMTATDAKKFLGDCMAVGKQKKQAADRKAAQQAKDEARQRAANARIRATIALNDVQMIDVRSELLDAVIAANAVEPSAPVLYVRNGMLVRVKRSEKNIWSIREAKLPDMKHVMANVADWVNIKETEDDYKEVATFPPESVASDFLTMPEWFGLPSLAEIVECPVFTIEGQLHDTPGYSEHSRMYYTGGVEAGDSTPTPERIAWAKEMLLTELLGDFPLVDDASKAHALAYTLVPFVRDAITGPVPPLLINAPTEGSGKGLLTAACAYPALGRTIPTMAFTNNDEELDKRITSKLLAGDTHAVLDNVNYELDSGVLANAWTQTVYEGRMLGHSQMPKLENRMIWAVTANNIVLSAENARRCVWVQIDANVERPSMRNGFRHPNLMQWIADNRNELVTACITLVRAWVDAGMPAYKGPRRKGSYESWVAVMGGILDVIGVPGFLANDDELIEKAVSKTDLMRDFVNEWWTRHWDKDTHPADLFYIASYYDNEPSIYAERDSNADTATEERVILPTGEEANPFHETTTVARGMGLLNELITGQRESGRAVQLGKLLGKHVDRIVDGLKIVKGKKEKGRQWWRLEDKTGKREKPSPVVPTKGIDNLLKKGEAAGQAADKQQPLQRKIDIVVE